MRKLLAAGLISFSLLAVPTAANAQMFLLGLGAGLVLGSSSSTSTGPGLQGDGANVLYLMPRAAERVTEPLALRQTSTECYYPNERGNGKTLLESFAATIKNSESFEIVQVLRAASSNNNRCLLYIIIYIDKSKVVPLARLPALTQK